MINPNTRAIDHVEDGLEVAAVGFALALGVLRALRR